MEVSKNQLIRGSGELGGGYVDFKIWIGELNNPDGGLVIPNSDVDGFEIVENMFSFLPSFSIQIADSGRLFNSHLIKAGDELCVSLSPNDSTYDEEVIIKPFLLASYVIQGIESIPVINENYFLQRLFCIYNAESVLNEVLVYPPNDDYFKESGRKRIRSSEVLSEVLKDTSLGFVEMVETDDVSHWVSCNETKKDFIERVVDSAWVGENDSPLIYTNKNGIVYLNSIKNLSESSSRLNFKHRSVIGSDNFGEGDISIDEISFLNNSRIALNGGGYDLKCNLYNPYISGNLNKEEFKKSINDGNLSNSAVEGCVVSDYSDGGLKLSSISNKINKKLISNNVDCGMVFDDLHEHYNVASYHNEMVRRNFFHNFIKFTIDTSKQNDYFIREEFRPELGMKVRVDLSSKEKSDTIYNGEYIIVEIKHKYQKRLPYCLEVVVVSDGYNGSGR